MTEFKRKKGPNIGKSLISTDPTPLPYQSLPELYPNAKASASGVCDHHSSLQHLNYPIIQLEQQPQDSSVSHLDHTDENQTIMEGGELGPLKCIPADPLNEFWELNES
ncbi:hypothetical protein CKAN_01690300 [Cinnamomum micranthum f. kanehirae]|uniref:Uncharacterized protein n=1 Tax=Cinnamomum micranthum f. kanehirae TaxID=337451 RepID=A0A3S3N456_9MAGN|nr:hypothetical protein CKAN_01690300 [Cinnamomum micranthum f. kanehirae]